jgi:hypothetical protein
LRRVLALAALLAASCATPQPGPEALERLLGADARAYSLVTVESGIAHYERTVREGAVARTQMAVCRSERGAWRCSGPFDAVRVSTAQSVQRLAAARDVDDAAVLRLVGYLQSDCLERQAAQFGRRIADRRLTAIEQHSDRYEVALGGPYRVDLLTLQRAEDACRFELRAHRQITFD